MFRVGALISIALVLSLVFGCSEKTTDTQPTGVQISFGNCITFLVYVTIDGKYVGSFSSERPWFIEVPAGSHTLEANANLTVVLGDTSFCWGENFSVSEGNTTQLALPCDTAGCPGSR